MKVLSAEFIISAARAAQFPHSLLPEVAFAGKSNVGKSSLINSLLNRKHLVKTSATPGKTRQINFFSINGAFLLVDLPGYGYAAVSKREQAGWGGLVEQYVAQREPLRGLVLIVDARHEPGPLDVQMRQWLAARRVPHLVVANKADKLSRGQVQEHMQRIAQGLALPEPPLAFSSHSGAGRAELWARLRPWLERTPGGTTGGRPGGTAARGETPPAESGEPA